MAKKKGKAAKFGQKGYKPELPSKVNVSGLGGFGTDFAAKGRATARKNRAAKMSGKYGGRKGTAPQSLKGVKVGKLTGGSKG